MKRTRTLLAAAAAIAGLVAFAGPAQAVPPQAEPSDPFVLLGTDTKGLDGYCDFPVEVVFISNPGPVHKPRGNASTGFISATVTNQTTGKTLTFNISGPGTFTTAEDGSFTIDTHGANLLYTTVENLSEFPDVPQLAYTTGHVYVEVDATGETTVYELNGKSTDVCAELS